MRTKEPFARWIAWWAATAIVTVATAIWAALYAAGKAESCNGIVTYLATMLLVGVAITDLRDVSLFLALLRLSRIKAAGAFSSFRAKISRAVRGLAALFTIPRIQTEP